MRALPALLDLRCDEDGVPLPGEAKDAKGSLYPAGALLRNDCESGCQGRKGISGVTFAVCGVLMVACVAWRMSDACVQLAFDERL